MKKLILLFTVALMMQSCNITVEVSAYTDYDLTLEQKNNICWTSDTTSLIGLTNDSRIYAINPDQMRDLLVTKEKALVYRWSPYEMENVIPIYFVQSYCNENNIELYVITNEYKSAFTEINNVKNPMSSMNIGDYITDISYKSENKFYKQLLGNKYKKKCHLYYFENGKYVRTEDEIVNDKWREKWN
ncbi:MAG: hypothetical protein IKV80_03205 [Bacteroidales bacterium]|nr:hypothetical protein [Bacteroidales bacterium]